MRINQADGEAPRLFDRSLVIQPINRLRSRVGVIMVAVTFISICALKVVSRGIPISWVVIEPVVSQRIGCGRRYGNMPFTNIGRCLARSLQEFAIRWIMVVKNWLRCRPWSARWQTPRLTARSRQNRRHQPLLLGIQTSQQGAA